MLQELDNLLISDISQHDHIFGLRVQVTVFIFSVSQFQLAVIIEKLDV